MKKNWLPIVLCFAFVVAYHHFFLNPYYAKERAAQEATKAKVAPPAAAAAASADNAKPVNPAAPQAVVPVLSSGPLSEDDRKQALSLELASQRTLKVFPDFSIGAAEFGDYSDRTSKEKRAIVVLPESLRWSSSSPLVQECLSGLRTSGSAPGATLSREFQSKAGFCRLRVGVDPRQKGLVHLELALRGFEGSQGFIEFKGTDSVGAGPAQDHNYLGYKVDGSKTWVREKDLLETQKKEGKVEWTAWGDRYFVTLLVPKGNYNPNVVYGAAPGGDANNLKASFGYQYPIFPSTTAEVVYELSAYFGPRDAEVLAEISPKLSEAVDLGFFGAIARLLIWALKKLNLVFNNYGLSIIALTVLVRLAFWPLNRKVFVSGIKMKALQPEMERLKAKYGNDKSKMDQMNRELIGLYKTHKVNPAGSCMPLLLQLPIFIGLYSALNHSIDLYQAPFFGWITDLSWKDPLYIFPALWTVSLLAYMRINPQPTQPGQPDMKWVMMGMNVFFGFLSKDWPSGLTLYLFVSNLVGVVQQVMLKRDPKLKPIQEGA